MKNITAQAIALLTSEAYIISRHFVQGSVWKILVPCLARMRIEVEAPNDSEAGHLSTASSTAGSTNCRVLINK